MNASETKVAAPPPPARMTWKRRGLRVLRSLIFIYLGVTLGCSMLQERMIFPGQSSQGQTWANIATAEDRELVKLKTDLGDTVFVLMGLALNPDGTPRPDASKRPTIILFYGNGMALSDLVGLCRDWRKQGANVIGVEYPGYGMSSGKPGEKPFYSAANASWDYLKQRGDIDMSKIIPAGISIGTGVAVELAHTHPAAGLILLSPMTSLDAMGREVLPIFPTSLILRHHFDNLSKIPDLKIPIVILHGNHDSLIPTRMSGELARAATKSPQVTHILIDSDHNDILELGEVEITAQIRKLIEQVAQNPR